MIKKHTRIFAWTALGLLLAVMLYAAFFSRESPSKARLDFALSELGKEQKRLGIQCINGDKFILDYIDAAVSITEKIANGQQLSASDSIIAQGDKAFDVMTTCGLLKNMTEADNLHILSNLALGDDSVRQGVSIIRLAVSRTVAAWCGVDCIQTARKEIQENSSLVRQLLNQRTNKPA